MKTKVCGICKVEKGLSEFSPHPKALYGVYPNCKKCRAAISRDYYYKNRERLLAQQRGSKRKANYNRNFELKRKYGLTPEQYAHMHDFQSGKCAICGRSGDILHVDHDHRTGNVRSLLCKSCNVAIGLLGDSAALCLLAYEYLDFWDRNQQSAS